MFTLFGSAASCGLPAQSAGLAATLVWRFEQRFSFCCGWWRKRQTPPSTRFLGRRVYVPVAEFVGALIALAMAHAEAARATGPRGRTVARWLGFFQRELQATRFWRSVQGAFSPPLAALDMPASLVERFAFADVRDQLLGVLKFVTPITDPGWR